MRSAHNHVPVVVNDKDPQQKQTTAVKKLEQCPFCDSKLLFTHDLNLSYLQVVETSRCPGCGVTMRPKTFTLH